MFLKNVTAAKRQANWMKLKGKTHILNPMAAKISYAYLRDGNLTVSRLRKLLLAKANKLCWPRPGQLCKFGCRTPPYLRHILGGCRQHKGQYVLRHDRVVRALYRLMTSCLPECELVVRGAKRPKEVPTRLPARIFGRMPLAQLGEVYKWDLQPDLTVIDHGQKHVHILEIGVTNRPRIAQLLISKPAHYKRLQEAIQLGREYTCSLHGVVVGNLGEITAPVINTLAKVTQQSPQKLKPALKSISARLARDALHILSLNYAVQQQ